MMRFSCTFMLAIGLLQAGINPGMSDTIPKQFQGEWGQACSQPNAPRLSIGADSITLTANGFKDVYGGFAISRTWYGGVRASGDRKWLLVSKQPDQAFVFIAEVVDAGAHQMLQLEEGHPDYAPEIAARWNLFGQPLERC